MDDSTSRCKGILSVTLFGTPCHVVQLIVFIASWNALENSCCKQALLGALLVINAHNFVGMRRRVAYVYILCA